jgi:hypothetical protein
MSDLRTVNCLSKKKRKRGLKIRIPASLWFIEIPRRKERGTDCVALWPAPSDCCKLVSRGNPPGRKSGTDCVASWAAPSDFCKLRTRGNTPGKIVEMTVSFLGQPFQIPASSGLAETPRGKNEELTVSLRGQPFQFVASL